MVTLNQVQNGIVKYIDNELIPMISGWKKWGFGAVSALWVSNINETFSKLKESEIVKMLGVIDEHNMIDIDKLYREFYAQAQKASATLDLPIVGQLTLDKNDVEKIYRYIMEG
jgi:hypothetical protein